MIKNRILNIFFFLVLLKQALFVQKSYATIAVMPGYDSFSGFLSIVDETIFPKGNMESLNDSKSVFRRPITPGIAKNTNKLHKTENSAINQFEEATLSFGTQNINTVSVAKTFTIRGNALNGAVTIAATPPFIISKDSVAYTASIGYSAEELLTNKIVFVKFRPTFAGNFTGSIINTSEGADSKYLNLTGTAVNPDSKTIENRIVANNIITPNGDGKNDAWIIENIESYPSNTVKVLDKAGRVVYSKQNYTNDWNGTYNNAPLSQGTYFYIVELGAGLATFKGYITIIRD